MITNATPRIISKTILLVLLAIFSLTILYIVWRYFWPPILRLPPSEIASQIRLETNLGIITIVLDGQSDFAKAQFTRLCRIGFYNQNRFHRIVPNLLIEAGDPLTKDPSQKNLWGQGGLGTAFPNQTYLSDRFTAGTVAFTGSSAKTYGSQFFITTKDTSWLKNRHTILGHVISGMDVVRQIETASTSATGLPNQDIIITSIECI